jgi:hypothetical protein
MAFADPQTFNSLTLPRTGFSNNGADPSVFNTADGTTKLTINHNYGKRTRRTIRLDFSKIAADPLVSAQNIKYSMAAYLVVDVPVTGFTVAEAKAQIDALTAYLTASTGARVTQLLGGEN